MGGNSDNSRYAKRLLTRQTSSDHPHGRARSNNGGWRATTDPAFQPLSNCRLITRRDMENTGKHQKRLFGRYETTMWLGVPSVEAFSDYVIFIGAELIVAVSTVVTVWHWLLRARSGPESQ
jgi:hypothetical protein